MKRYITILVAVMALHTLALAQNKLGAKIDVRNFEYQDDSVKLDIDFDFDQLNIAPNQSVVFSPTIFKGNNSISLPTVVVKRRGGSRSFNRATTLDDTKKLMEYESVYGTPYQVIEYFGSNKQSQSKYSLTIPYQKWMVDSELYVDCKSYGCCKVDDRGMLIPDDNTLSIIIPTIDTYELNPRVELIKPEKVAVKMRDIQYSSALIFRVNSTYIDPNLERNRNELTSIDTMMQSVLSDSDYTITKINIIGFASPEGTLEGNMRLSKGRAAALETLMKKKYTTIDQDVYSVEFGGENWDKLYEIVGQSDWDFKDDVMDIIKNVPIDQGRETKLMSLNGGTTYRYLLKNVFPATRLVLIDVKFNIDAYDLVRISELIDTKPENLSLEEMYRLSEQYDLGDEMFEKIFLTAARIYPDDEVAMNNALAAEIRQGNTTSVKHIAERVNKQTKSAELANSLGAYYMLSGDYATAKTMLQRAIDLGSKRAQTNMNQLSEKLENLQHIEENEAFRAKIYGE